MGQTHTEHCFLFEKLVQYLKIGTLFETLNQYLNP